MDFAGEEDDILELAIKHRDKLSTILDVSAEESSESELAAMVSFAIAFPGGFMALVDTYDVKRYFRYVAVIICATHPISSRVTLPFLVRTLKLQIPNLYLFRCVCLLSDYIHINLCSTQIWLLAFPLFFAFKVKPKSSLCTCKLVVFRFDIYFPLEVVVNSIHQKLFYQGLQQ